jgi:hypothetical protein
MLHRREVKRQGFYSQQTVARNKLLTGRIISLDCTAMLLTACFRVDSCAVPHRTAGTWLIRAIKWIGSVTFCKRRRASEKIENTATYLSYRHLRHTAKLHVPQSFRQILPIS